MATHLNSPAISYLPATHVNVPHLRPNPSQAGWYSIHLPPRQQDRRLSWQLVNIFIRQTRQSQEMTLGRQKDRQKDKQQNRQRQRKPDFSA